MSLEMEAEMGAETGWEGENTRLKSDTGRSQENSVVANDYLFT